MDSPDDPSRRPSGLETSNTSERTSEKPSKGCREGRGVMHIGEVATRTELSLRSLRHWEEVGLLTPSGRTEGGFRLYTEDDVNKILIIRRMKPLGFSLDEMKAVMHALAVLRSQPVPAGAITDARAHLAAVRDEAANRRQKLVRQLEMADEFISLLTQTRDT